LLEHPGPSCDASGPEEGGLLLLLLLGPSPAVAAFKELQQTE
jgi:hypothetical protein